MSDSPEGIRQETEVTGLVPPTYQTGGDIKKGFVYKRVPHIMLKAIANNELIVFITPYVIDEPNEMLPETTEEIEAPRRKLEGVRDKLDDTMEKLKEELERE